MQPFVSLLAEKKDLYLEDSISYTYCDARREVIEIMIEGLRLEEVNGNSIVLEAPTYPFLLGKRFIGTGAPVPADDLFLQPDLNGYTRLTLRYCLEKVHCSFTLCHSGGVTPFAFSEIPLNLWNELRSHLENRHDKTKTDHIIHTTVHGSEINFVWYEETKRYVLVLADSYNNALLQQFNVQSSLLLTEMFTRWLKDLEAKLFYPK